MEKAVARYGGKKWAFLLRNNLDEDLSYELYGSRPEMIIH